jgi:alpha-D-ribose 1-methylphosphonate 5-triphosphate diphosphatase
MRTLVVNGRVLQPDGELLLVPLLIEDGRIACVGETHDEIDNVLDACGSLVLPGMVDLHGDAFERQLLPRPDVHFPTDLALLETDRQMLGNGITTAFHGITYSWEPGLRGRNSALGLIAEIERLRPQLGCDTRVHLRWETFNLDGEADVEWLLRENRIDLLAFNDHIDDIREDISSGKRHKLGVYTHRTGLDAEAFRALFESISGRSDEVPAAVARLAGLAGEHGVPCASHDDVSSQTRRWYHERGVMLSEFPVSAEVALASREFDNTIILGGPNVVRGGSHCNRLSAAAAAEQGLCDVLTSDYYYPSMLGGAFQLVEQNGLTLGDAWSLVSANPAAAAGLSDRGDIKEGKRADLVMVDDAGPLPRVVSTIVAGEVAYSTNCLRLH